MSKEIDEVKKVLKSLLVTVPNGMYVAQLENEFREMEGRSIPRGRFESIVGFLESIPETVRLSVRGGQRFVHPVISRDNNHIMKLVSEQIPNRKPAYKRYFPPQPNRNSHSLRRPTVHQHSNHIRPQAACQSKHSTKTAMSSKHEQYNDAWHSHTENAKLFVAEMIEADFNFGKSSNTMPAANILQSQSIAANATFDANAPEKNTKNLTQISPSEEYSQKFENSTKIPVRAVADYYPGSDGQTDDENDALPKMTRFEFMTLIDDEEFIITNEDPFADLSLSQHEIGGVGSTMKIIVSEVHSPYKFWFQLQNSMADLEELMDALKFYDDNILNKDLHLPEHLIRPGQICVALYRKQWHRARIVDVYEDEAIKVFYLDYGTVDEVFVDEIRLMRKDCAELLPQAFRGCLDNIRPSGGLWTRQATQTFKSAVENINVYANVTAIDTEEKTYYVNITDTTKEVDVNINDVLIDTGHALHEKERMVQMKSRHYNERYPTFDMLENGEYPSFAEIGYFQSQGYNFAIYEQSIIIPEMRGYSTNI